MTTQTETFTREQVDQQVKAAVAAEAQKHAEAAEEAAAKDDPDALAQLRARRAQQRKEQELRQREETVAERETRLRREADAAVALSRETDATSIAAEFQVSRETLLEFTDGSKEKMRTLAARLPKQGGEGNPTGFKPDSGRTSGGGSKTVDQIRQDYITNPTPENRAAYAATRK